MRVIYQKHKEINKSQWDEIIASSANGNIYAFSWYLDAVCPGWDALVCEDYSMVMPLTWNKKFGFSYLFRPLLSQQLGIYSNLKISKLRAGLMFDAMPKKYRLIQYCLNKQNPIPEGYQSVFHTSYELSLSGDYENLRSSYSDNHKRNLKKTESLLKGIRNDVPVENFFILMLKDDSPGSKILLEKKNTGHIKSLIDKMAENQALKIIGLDNEQGELIAAILFGYSHNTWYYLAPVSNIEGKKTRAHFLLIDHWIRVNSGKDEVLDFEGSNLPGLARFYSGFGATAIQYPEILKNSLPWPIKYLK